MLQLEIGVFLYMSLLLYTTESCTSEDIISGIQFDNQFTTVHKYKHPQTVYHFEEQSDSSDKVLFSSYGHISVSKGISSNSLRNAELIAGDRLGHGYKEGIGDHARFRGITDFCQNGTHIIVVDRWNHCIRSIYNGNGHKSTANLAGRCGNLGYVNGETSSALFNLPHSILITKSGNNFLYLVTDTGNNAIRLIDADNGEVTTFVHASEHLIKPIDLIFSQDLSSLYVTTQSGLTMVSIQSRRINPISSLSSFGSLYKMTWLTNNTYLISEKLDEKLVVLDTKNYCNNFTLICNQQPKSGNCRLYQPYSVFLSTKNLAIIVGAYQRIHQLKVCEGISKHTNPSWHIPNWILTTTTTSTTSTTTTTTPSTSSTSTAGNIVTETPDKLGIVASKELNERYDSHLFIIYGLVALVTIILLVTSAMMYRALRTVSNSTRCMHVSEHGTTRPLPVRPGAPSLITTISTYNDHTPLRNSGLSSESGTHTNHLHSMSNGSPQVPMRTNRRNADGYMPMRPSCVKPDTEYTRMNNAVYHNNQPEGINSWLLNGSD